jgi:hypothetical protein
MGKYDNGGPLPSVFSLLADTAVTTENSGVTWYYYIDREGILEMSTNTTTIGTRAIELMRALRQHEAGSCDAGATLFAVFGVNSPQGRFADTFAFNNPPYFLWLEDIAYDHGVGDQILRDYSKIRKSEAAQTMFEHRLCSHGRKVTMTEGARNALLNYYLEKIELIIILQIY